MKENSEGSDLVGYLTELFLGWVGSQCEVVISILAAYRVDTLKNSHKFPCGVLIKFSHWGN